MHARLNSALAATLPLLVCLVSSVSASRHRHQQQHQSDNSLQSLDSSKSSLSEVLDSTIAYHSAPKTRTKQRTADDQAGSLNTIISNMSPNKAADLLREYMSRQLFMCSSNYISTLSKLHALIKEAYEEYADCQKQLRNSPKNYGRTSFTMLNELLAEWKSEDEEKESSSSVEIEGVNELRPPSHTAQCNSWPYRFQNCFSPLNHKHHAQRCRRSSMMSRSITTVEPFHGYNSCDAGYESER